MAGAALTGTAYVKKDSALELTCDYTFDASATTTPSFTKDGTTLSSGVTDGFTYTVHKSSIFTVTSAAFSDSAGYACSVTHSSPSTTVSATPVTVTIRGADPTDIISTVYVSKDSTATLTCKFKGDNPDTITWKDNDGNAVTTTGDYTLGTKSYTGGVAQNTLTVATVDYTEGQNLTCEASWTSGVSTTATQQQLLQPTGPYSTHENNWPP